MTPSCTKSGEHDEGKVEALRRAPGDTGTVAPPKAWRCSNSVRGALWSVTFAVAVLTDIGNSGYLFPTTAMTRRVVVREGVRRSTPSVLTLARSSSRHSSVAVRRAGDGGKVDQAATSCSKVKSRFRTARTCGESEQHARRTRTSRRVSATARSSGSAVDGLADTRFLMAQGTAFRDRRFRHDGVFARGLRAVGGFELLPTGTTSPLQDGHSLDVGGAHDTPAVQGSNERVRGVGSRSFRPTTHAMEGLPHRSMIPALPPRIPRCVDVSSGSPAQVRLGRAVSGALGVELEVRSRAAKGLGGGGYRPFAARSVTQGTVPRLASSSRSYRLGVRPRVFAGKD